MGKDVLDKEAIEVRSSIVKNWLVYVRGYRLESRHRMPVSGSFGSMRYRDTWILTPKK